MRVGPALGDKVSVPAQQGCRLDDEVPEAVAGDQSCESRQHRPIRRLERRSVDLAPKDRHLETHDHDLDGEIGVTAEDASDELGRARTPGRGTRGSGRQQLAANLASLLANRLHRRILRP